MLELEYSNAQSDLTRDCRTRSVRRLLLEALEQRFLRLGFGAYMQNKTTKPKSIIYYYVFICVLIGSVETSMNQKIFEQKRQKEAAVKAVEVAPVTPSAPVQTEQLEWEGCPTKEGVLASIAACNALIADTQKLAAALHNEGDAEEQKFRSRLEQWKSGAKVWKIRNDSILQNCDYLLGATGVPAIPEIPLALENLKNAETWLGWSIESAKAGKDNAARAYIASARLATKRASNLINGRVKPRAKTALVSLPKYLQRKQKEIEVVKRPSKPVAQDDIIDLTAPAEYRVISY